MGVAARHVVEVVDEPVLFAGQRHDVHVVHVALRAVQHKAQRLAHRRRLKHRPRESGPVGRDRLAAHHVGMRLEVYHADRQRALAVDAQHLHRLVRRLAVRLYDVGILHARIGIDLPVLHLVPAAERDPLRHGARHRKAGRLEIRQRLNRRVRRAGRAQLAVHPRQRRFSPVRDLLGRGAQRPAVVRVRSVQEDRIARNAGRLRDRIAHQVVHMIGYGNRIDLHDESLRLAVAERHAVDLQRIEHRLRVARLVVAGDVAAKRRRDVNAGEPGGEFHGSRRGARQHQPEREHETLHSNILHSFWTNRIFLPAYYTTPPTATANRSRD